jgi:hypothetical protein
VGASAEVGEAHSRRASRVRPSRHRGEALVLASAADGRCNLSVGATDVEVRRDRRGTRNFELLSSTNRNQGIVGRVQITVGTRSFELSACLVFVSLLCLCVFELSSVFGECELPIHRSQLCEVGQSRRVLQRAHAASLQPLGRDAVWGRRRQATACTEERATQGARGVSKSWALQATCFPNGPRFLVWPGPSRESRSGNTQT